MKNILKLWLAVLMFCNTCVQAAELARQQEVLPLQAGPAHPGQRPLPEDNETQKEYGKRIDAWEKQMQAYEAAQREWPGHVVEQEEKKEAAARAQESQGFSPETPEEVFAELLVKMRKQIPGVGTDLKNIAKTVILPDVEQESVVLRGGGVHSLGVSPDGHYIMGFDYDGLKIWDTKNFYAEPIVLKNIASLHMLAGGRGMFLDKGGTAIQFFGILDGRLDLAEKIDLRKQAIYLHNSVVRVSPDGRYVALNNVKDADHKQYVFVWDVQDLGKEPQRFESDESSFMLSSRYLAVPYAGKVRLWQRDVAGGFEANFIELKGDVDKKTYFLLSPDGRYLVGYNTGASTIMVWDMHNLEQEPRKLHFEDGFYGAKFLGNNNVLVVVKADPEGDMITDAYDLDNLDAAPILLGTDYNLFSLDGRYGIRNLTMRLSIDDLQYHDIDRFLGVQSAVMVFLPNGKYLVTGNDNAVTVWNWALVTRAMARQRARVETENKKRLPGESWFTWMKRIAPEPEEQSDDEEDDGGDDGE